MKIKPRPNNDADTRLASPDDASLALKRENELLRAEIAELRAFADSLFEMETHGIFLVDEETGRIEKANAAASKIYGFDNEELREKAMADLSDAPEPPPGILEQRRTFLPLRHHLRKNGTTFPVEVSIKYFTHNGKPKKFVAVRDITLRHTAMEKLHVAETIVENSPVALFQCSVDAGRPIEFASHNVLRFGFDPEELSAKRTPYESLIHPEDREGVAREMASFLGQGLTRFPLRYRLLSPTGQIYHVEENVFAQSSLARQFSYFQGVVMDITEEVEAQRSQKENEALFLALFSAVQDAIYVLDDAFRILILNQAGSRRHGMTRGEMIGENYPGLFPERTAERCQRKLQTVLKKGKPVRFVNILEGKRFDCAAFPIRDNKGQVRQIAVFSRDVTNAYATRDKLRQAKRASDMANRAKSDYLAAMSHEIRTPIHAVNGMVELLLDSGLDEETTGRLDRVKSTMTHLNSLITNILDLSKIESGKLELESADFDLIELVRAMGEDLDALAGRKGLDFQLHIAKSAPRFVRGDPTRLRQILFNLGTNAIKFTESGSVSLRLSCDVKGPGPVPARFTVSDTGIGIASKRLSAVFEPFRQADGTYARRYGGAGLGLAICKQLAELMGGEILAESDEGKGSVFTVRLVLERGRAQKTIETQPARTGVSRHTSRRILLAEDNPVNSEVALESLARAGHKTILAGDGKQAIEILTDTPFDIILMDVEMPEMDGIEATQRIREGAAGENRRKTPIIGVTAHALAEVRNKSRDAGMDVCVTKPVDFKSLLDIIESLTDQGQGEKPPIRTVAPLRSDSPAGILNRTEAIERLQGNVGLYERILGDFLERAPKAVASIDGSMRESNLAETAALSHALAGSLAAIGAETSQALAKGLVTAAKEENAGQAVVLFGLLKEELEKVKSLLLHSATNRPPSSGDGPM